MAPKNLLSSPLPVKTAGAPTDGQELRPLFWFLVLKKLYFKDSLAHCCPTTERHLLRSPKINMLP